MLNKPIFHMGASFDNIEDEINFEVNGNNNCKKVKDENIPLVPRK